MKSTLTIKSVQPFNSIYYVYGQTVRIQKDRNKIRSQDSVSKVHLEHKY